MPNLIVTVLLIIGFIMLSKKTTGLLESSGLGNLSLPRGLRNNNPFNLIKTDIKWNGKLKNSSDSKFEQFENYFYGLRAGMIDLRTDIKKGKNTLFDLMHEFAPSSENDTTAYIKRLATATGLSPTDALTFDAIPVLSMRIIEVENGSCPFSLNDLIKVYKNLDS